MPGPEDSHHHDLPEDLRVQLATFQRQLWRIKVTEAFLAGLCGLLLSFLVVFLLDRLFATPPAARLGILVAGTSLFGFFAPLWIRRWVFGHRREEQLARLISRKFPRLGDRLLGVVELQDQDGGKENLSPELRAAAMSHVARQAAKRDMAEALPRSRHRQFAFIVAGAAALVLAGFFFSPRAGWNSLERWLFPFSETPRYTFTQFDLRQLPDPLIVPYGEPFSLTLPLSATTDERPERAVARYGSQEWLEADLDGSTSTYSFTFPGQQTPRLLTLKAGDATHRLSVQPEIRPELTELSATLKLPAYLELPNRQVDIRTGVLTALEGSQAILQGRFTRDLASAEASLTPLPDELSPTDPSEMEPRTVQMSLKGASLETAPLAISNRQGQLHLRWKDVKGLDGASRFRLRINPAADQRPSAYLQGIDRQIVILAEETLEFEVLCEDDFGLRELGLVWRNADPSRPATRDGKDELILKRGSPSTSRLSSPAVFSPVTHGIQPQKLLLSAYTEDYHPGRGRVYSDPLIVYILTPDEHAQRLKARFDRIIGALEDIARSEQNNLDSNQRLDRKSGEELQQEDALRKLAESTTREEENTDRMKKLTAQMEELFQDANRNRDLEPQTMKQLADSLSKLRDLGEEALPEVSEKLNEAQEKKNTAEKTKRDLQDAIQKQKDAVRKMQEAIQQANQANENFEAATFINRLKRAASEEERIASELIGAMSSLRIPQGRADTPLLGASPGAPDFDPVHSRLLSALRLQQSRTSADIRWIQEDLGHFHARTQKPEHKKLLETMRSSGIDLSLEVLRDHLTANQTFRSVHSAKAWAKKLREWAGVLGSSDQGGGGGGGGGGSQAEQDFEFMLKVMRMVQTQQDIRSRTRSLEQLKRSLELEKVTP